MFFSPELLTKRDSGFGLLWLAATLGARSVVRKLPKRMVLTANIMQLCDLVAQPSEPLALRLSSNLMVGVVRVYKVKQDILMCDVNSCVMSLKKSLQEFKAFGIVDKEQQMPQPTIKPCTFTVIPDPRLAYSLDFDALVVDWDQFLDIKETKFDKAGKTTTSLEVLDGETFIPQGRKVRKKNMAAPSSQVESGRQETHTLTEHHDHLLSASFDLSFSASNKVPGFGQSSSGPEIDFELNDTFFTFSDGLDMHGELDEDFAKELGWISSPIHSGGIDGNSVINNDDFNMYFNPTQATPVNENRGERKRKREYHPQENDSPKTPVTSPAISISLKGSSIEKRRKLFMPLRDITDKVNNAAVPRKRKVKRTALLDGRIELTDDELKIARARYLDAQIALRKEMRLKRMEKHNAQLINEIVGGAPQGIEAHSLTDFWRENFKFCVESRSGIFHARKKRRIMQSANDDDHNRWHMAEMSDKQLELAMPVDIDDDNIMTSVNDYGSNEPPEQARRVSRSGSIIYGSAYGVDIVDERVSTSIQSQRSSLFPWDNAVPSSSEYFDAPPELARTDMNVDGAYTRLRNDSNSLRRNSSLLPSQNGSVGVSPGVAGIQVSAEDYIFEVDRDAFMENGHTNSNGKLDLNITTLEKESSNFLEYTRMQHQILPVSTPLAFDLIVPKATSTPHVAAVAFYHCLVLATKDLVHLNQPEPYGSISINIMQ